MGRFQKLIFILSFLISAPAMADWGVFASHGGYLGDYALGARYSWNETHSVDVSFGRYEFGADRHRQVNVGYHYTPWQIHCKNHSWQPLDLGIYSIRSLDQDHYFRVSPEIYPEDNYYDQTQIRFGLHLGTTIRFVRPSISITSFMMLLDNGIVALYNNSRKDLTNYFFTYGISAVYHF